MSRRSSRAKRNHQAKALPQSTPKNVQNKDSHPSATTHTSLSVTHTSEARFHSILPPPEYLQQYDIIAPGTAKLIIEAGIRQTHHRIEMESKVVTAQVRRADRGLWCGLAIGIIGIGGGVAIALLVQTAAATVAGSILSGTTLVGLAGIFVYGTNSQRKEREQKSKDNP